MLTMRQRGKARIYYIRGSVSLGSKRIDVKEFSSGTSDGDAASHLMAEKETELRRQLMFGPSAVVVTSTIADAFDAYLTKPNRPNSSDVIRVGKMNEIIGDLSMADPHGAWETFRRAYLLDHATAGQDRYRSILQAAINIYRESHELDPVKIPTISFKNKSDFWTRPTGTSSSRPTHRMSSRSPPCCAFKVAEPKACRSNGASMAWI